MRREGGWKDGMEESCTHVASLPRAPFRPFALERGSSGGNSGVDVRLRGALDVGRDYAFVVGRVDGQFIGRVSVDVLSVTVSGKNERGEGKS